MNFPKFLVLLSISLISFQTINAQQKIKEWTAFTQVVKIQTNKKIKFKLSASVKTDLKEDNAQAGLWARVDETNKKIGFFDNMNDRPITENSWNTYTIEGVLDKKSNQIAFGGLCYNNGTFLFDDFKLFIENAKTGEFEEMELTNGGFEDDSANENIQGWYTGIVANGSEDVKGFSVKIINDDKFEGKNALKVVGNGVEKSKTNYIGELEGFSPQVGTLITMLDNMKERVAYTVQNMSTEELDYLQDENANTIGALLMHLIATENYYRIVTFEERDLTSEEMKEYNDAMELGDLGRKNIKDKNVSYYLDLYNEARQKTIEAFKQKDDVWLATTPTGSSVSNHFSWFHVMEHQSSHLGQILYLKKRIPENLDLKIKKTNKID